MTDSGAPPSSGSRIHEYIRTLERRAWKGPAGEWVWMTYELTQIAEGVLALGRDPQWSRVFKIAAKGRPVYRPRGFAFTDADRALAPPEMLARLDALLVEPDVAQDRDAQFEILVAGCFRSSGLKVDRSLCDGVVTIDDRPLAIEAKRIKSAARVVERLKKAADQIDDAGIPGIVVIDITPSTELLHPAELPTLAEDAFRSADRAAHEMIERSQDRVREKLAESRVIAVVVCASQPFGRPKERNGLTGAARRWRAFAAKPL